MWSNVKHLYLVAVFWDIIRGNSYDFKNWEQALTIKRGESTQLIIEMIKTWDEPKNMGGKSWSFVGETWCELELRDTSTAPT